MLWQTHIGAVLDENASEETEHTPLAQSIAPREATDQGKHSAAHKVDALALQPFSDGLFGDDLSTYEAKKKRDRSK
jgi:hypothetical protein